MKVEDVVGQIARVDRTIRNGDAVEDADRSINITGLYRRYGWGGAGPTPLSDDAQKQLQLADRTADDRWSEHFRANGRDLGLYRSLVGYYWLLRFDGAIGEHWLDHVGTAHDTATRFGDG